MIERFRYLSTACIFLWSVAPATGATVNTRVIVPDDTVVAVQVTEQLTSAVNHAGDVFDINVTGAVSAGGYIVVAANAKGRGHVTKIDEAGGHGHPGTVEVALDYVFAVDGEKIRLKDTPIDQIGEKAHSGATVAGIFTYGLASNAIRGHDAIISPTRTLEAHVAGSVHVVSSTKSDAPSSDAGFAH